MDTLIVRFSMPFNDNSLVFIGFWMSLDLLSLYLFNPETETLNLNMCLVVHLNMYTFMSMYFLFFIGYW